MVALTVKTGGWGIEYSSLTNNMHRKETC